MPVCPGFELIRILGAGAMAVVYEARSSGRGEIVALKILREEYAVDRECVHRFEREVRIAGRIRSRHVPKVFGLVHTEEGIPCMIMERLVGKSLSKVLEERGTLSVPESVKCMMQICAALANAHAVGVVHRDLKPSNVFFAEEAGSVVVKVMDFGLSKLEGDIELTGVHATFGTPRYMSPEQIRSPKLADQRSDLWALGVMLYRMLSGRYPFAAQGYAAVLSAIANTEPIHLADVMPDLDRLVASVVMNLLKKDPALRYQDVQELVSALQRFLEESGTLDTSDGDMSMPFLPTIPAPSMSEMTEPIPSSAPASSPKRYAMIPTPTNASRMNWTIMASDAPPTLRPADGPPVDDVVLASMRPPRWRVPVALAAIATMVVGFVLGAVSRAPSVPSGGFATQAAPPPTAERVEVPSVSAAPAVPASLDAPVASAQAVRTAVPTATAKGASMKERAFFGRKQGAH